MTRAPQPPALRFRLRGEVDGRERVFDLPAGGSTVGSARDNDVRLPVAGVSRRHALISASEGGLVVEDFESKNGTFVDGQRIRRAAFAAGSRVAFGPVELRVEGLGAGTELAIRFEAETDGASSLSGFERADTPLVSMEGDGDGEGLRGIEELVQHLPAIDDDEAPRRLAEALALEGLIRVEWTDEDEPIARAGWGELREIPSLAQIRRLPRSNAFADGVWRCGRFAADDLGSFAVRCPGRGRSGQTQGLLLWRSGRSPRLSARLLRILLRLLLLDRRSGDAGPAADHPADEPTLRFPAGYQIGRSQPLRDLYRQMASLCRGRRPILLHGETGVGKEPLARTLHDSSSDPQAPYVVVNCAAIPENLLEAEMFGIVKGAATGTEPRDGYFLKASGGTLFLDEIGELSPALQGKLLRTLQENEIQPVGGGPRGVDAWVIAATNVDLDSEHLRRDLYYRFAGGLLEVPALRHCRDDIPLLLRHFLEIAAGESDYPLRGVTTRALRLLTEYRWPGNVRELEHLMHRLVADRPPGGVLDEDSLPDPIRHRMPEPADPAEAERTADLALKPRLQALERRMIREALRRTGGRQKAAANLLGISRSGLAKMLQRLDLKEMWNRPDAGEVETMG